MSKGLLHFHSNFSYDGHNSIQEIAKWRKTEKIDFIILTEHDNDFDNQKFENYVNECEKHSKNIILVPGIEYSFGQKRPFPQSWAGLRNEELSALTGEEAVFCHKNRFVAVFKTREGALSAMKRFNLLFTT